MADLSIVTAWLLKMVVNPLLWLIIIIGIIALTLIFLKIRKKRRLKYDGAELIDLGNGKLGVNINRCGWIGKNLYLRGLWWSGREVMRDSKDDEILDYSDEDFQEVNGQRGVIYYRDPISSKKVPVNNLFVKNKQLVANIPPAQFIDTAIDIINDAGKETADWKEKIIMWAVMGGIIIFALVSIIVIIQMVKNGQDKAANLILESGKTCLEGAKAVCSEIASTIGKGGNAP